MNWYKIKKFAQIWNIGESYVFEENLKNLYRLEYQLSMLRTRPFNGVDIRRENIINQLKKALDQTLDAVKAPLLSTLEGWLSSHALTDSNLWASKRLLSRDYGDENERFDAVLSEYSRLKPYDHQPRFGYNSQMSSTDKAFREMMENATKSIKKYPALLRLLDIYVEEKKTMMEQELDSEGLEEFNSMYGTSFKSEDAARKYILKQTVQSLGFQYDFLDYFGGDYSTFVQAAERENLLDDICVELYKNQVFPMWYAVWKPQGIDKTRKKVEQVYKELSSANDFSKGIIAINHAIQTVHQNGSILDYLRDYGQIESYLSPDEIKNLLTNLTNSSQIEEWNKQLREIGVQI